MKVSRTNKLINQNLVNYIIMLKHL